jgi:phospholipase C
LVSQGQAHVTRLINAAMAGPEWKSTAIFLAWDDWGGFYDHVVPPGWTRTAMACGCPVWSSVPTPGRAISIIRR